MELKTFAKYKHIVIQCHDVPDADTIGSGFALRCFLRSLGTDAALVYGGASDIKKPSLCILLAALDINIDHISSLPPETDLLITVDCQRGAGNVQRFDLSDTAVVAVIDHHRPEIPENENTVIRPYLASCATLIWDMLNREGFVMEEPVQTALYYGLFTDTNGLSELRHPLDRDLSDIACDTGLIRKLKNSAITEEELDIVGNALRNREYIGDIGLFHAEPCDPNLLGFTSDIAQQVVHINCCVVYCLLSHGIKLSIRSSSREIMANEISGFLCRDAGSGGGTAEKAGGFISYRGIMDVSPPGKDDPEFFLKVRIQQYLDYYDLIYAGDNNEDFNAMALYKKLPVTVWFAKSADIFTPGTKITVRTMEGDVDTITSEDIYLMIGIKGEAYPIKKERFEQSYNVLGLHFTGRLEYVPAILNRLTSERRELADYAIACVPKDEKLVRARPLEKPAKVFTTWDTEKYFSGVKGDWLLATERSYEDCYIIRGDIFEETYEKVRI